MRGIRRGNNSLVVALSLPKETDFIDRSPSLPLSKTAEIVKRYFMPQSFASKPGVRSKLRAFFEFIIDVLLNDYAQAHPEKGKIFDRQGRRIIGRAPSCSACLFTTVNK